MEKQYKSSKIKNHKITKNNLSSDAMFEASSVYSQYVNERAAHVKNRQCFPSVSTWAVVNL